MCLVTAKAKAAGLLAAADEAGKELAMLDLDAATKELEAARKAFNEWSYDKLAALHKEDINETSSIL